MPDSTIPAAAAFHDHDHGGCTASVLAQAETVAAAHGVRLTAVRRRVLEILLESHRAMGAYDVLDRLAADGFARQPPVAYRALEFLVENGLAHRIQRLNAFAACMHPGQDHEAAFLICRACGTLAETPAVRLRAAFEASAAPTGFRVERASFEAVGLCPSCQTTEAA